MVAPPCVHFVTVGDARRLAHLADGSVDLVVTSPPYPMIEMWDGLFERLDPTIGGLLDGDERRALDAHERMHRELDRVWRECHRCLRSGRLLCINIGDATRSLGGRFRLYPNHARIIEACRAIGFDSLPLILWRKQTNAPNKFMGSGMFPAGAYVTLEHEYILLFRKGPKRLYDGPEAAQNRRESAYFWEERNVWFSDVWDFKGSRQALAGGAARDRSGAFPIELAFRLVSMFSVRGDLVLDPFLGTGTTLAAAALAGRNGAGVEIDGELAGAAVEALCSSGQHLRRLQEARLEAHLQFAEQRRLEGRPCAYLNRPHGFPVVTRQEVDLRVDLLRSLTKEADGGGAMKVSAAYDSPRKY